MIKRNTVLSVQVQINVCGWYISCMYLLRIFSKDIILIIIDCFYTQKKANLYRFLRNIFIRIFSLFKCFAFCADWLKDYVLYCALDFIYCKRKKMVLLFFLSVAVNLNKINQKKKKKTHFKFVILLVMFWTLSILCIIWKDKGKVYISKCYFFIILLDVCIYDCIHARTFCTEFYIHNEHTYI